MGASSNILVDHHGMYPKRTNPSFSACSGGGGVTGFLAPRPLVPIYSSLPPSHLLQQPQPPLLPIPLSKFSSLPSPISPGSSRRTAGGAAARTANKDPKKVKSYPSKLQKAAQFGVTRPQKEAAVPKSAVAATTSAFEDELPLKEEDGDLAGDVYSLSPPPSSLPMPRFSLRARNNAEEFGGGFLVVGGGGGDAGASDDLRRLLRL